MADIISTDFAIAASLDEPAIDELFACFERHPEPTVRLTGAEVLSEAERLTSRVQRETVLMCLWRNKGSEQVLDGPSLLESTYLFDIERCLAILEEQCVAARALTQQSNRTDSTTVQTVATVPAGVELAKLSRPDVSALPPRLRRLMLEAQSSVRIANPYFDPTEQIIDDIIALPQKGVRTQILTREVDMPDHVETFDRFRDKLDSSKFQNLEVRDLYELDTEGRQATATHAKLMIVDESVAYVGSANLTTTSLGTNFELGVLVRGPPVADLAAVFDLVFATATSVNISSGGD